MLEKLALCDSYARLILSYAEEKSELYEFKERLDEIKRDAKVILRQCLLWDGPTATERIDDLSMRMSIDIIKKYKNLQGDIKNRIESDNENR